MSEAIIDKMLDIEYRPEFRLLAEAEFNDRLFAFQTTDDKTAYGLTIHTQSLEEGKSEVLVVARVGDEIRPFVFEKSGEKLINIYDLNYCLEGECDFLMSEGHVLHIPADELEIKLLEAVSGS